MASHPPKRVHHICVGPMVFTTWMDNRSRKVSPPCEISLFPPRSGTLSTVPAKKRTYIVMSCICLQLSTIGTLAEQVVLIPPWRQVLVANFSNREPNSPVQSQNRHSVSWMYLINSQVFVRPVSVHSTPLRVKYRRAPHTMTSPLQGQTEKASGVLLEEVSLPSRLSMSSFVSSFQGSNDVQTNPAFAGGVTPLTPRMTWHPR